MKDQLLIIGAGGHGKVVAEIALKMNKWKKIAFLDDDNSLKLSMGLNVIGTSNDVFDYIDHCDIFLAIGNNETRQRFQQKLETAGASIPLLVHPNAIVGKQVELGIGTVVMAGAIINCCTKIGKGCIINTGSTIDHDNYIEDFVHISPGAHLAGKVRVGQGSWLGIGSIAINNINITNKCTIGAGAVVIKDLTESGTYVGVPVRYID